MTDNYAISETNKELLRKSEALKKIHEHNRDYLSLTLTIPLGDPALKNVHTNQWLFTNLPKEFDLANWTVLADALNANTNRYEQYVKNRWYIEAIDISVEAGGKREMKLTLNAFASSYNSYIESARGMYKAYTDAQKNKSNTNNTNKSNSVSANSNIKNGWWGNWVTKFVQNTVGNETDVLKRCKLCYNKFRDRVYYQEYNDMQKTGGDVNKLEKVWNNDPHINCGDGANFLSAFYNCCGATAGIYLSNDRAHYIVKCTVAGKDYWTDQSGAEGCHNTLRGWNETWGNYRSGSYRGKYV